MVNTAWTKATSEAEKPAIRAAQYVRMSTEHQKYSTENQAETIRKYAEERGIEIVRTYADEGKSGLRLDGRDALKRLLDEIKNGQTDFSTVLVYDISRWGRFQDADESASHEFQCRSAGISVQYCAEQFENDGSLSATIIKGMKRAMAGEYSRELSTKVFAGQCRLIALGFRQGGTAGYGLRRRLVDENRQPKAELHHKEYKSIQTDRVILIPGPDEEVQTVRRMYRMFVEESRPEREIATILNREGKLTDLGRPWTRGTVHQILTNEKYIGNNVYNRISFKLKRERVVNSPDMWVRANNVFQPIVEHHLFEAARIIISGRSQNYSDSEMLERLSSLLKAAGWLSGLIIDEQDNMPSSSAYRHRFGSLLRAYQLVGYTPNRDYRYIETNRFLRSLHPDIVADAIAAIGDLGGSVARNPTTDLLTINDEFTASIVIARCFRTQNGALRWKIRLDTGLRPDISVILRMDAENKSVLDCYLLPRLDLGDLKLRIGEDNGIFLDAYRFTALDAFFDLSGRIYIEAAA